MQKHAQATWRFETCWKTVRGIAQNCSKLALTGQESRWAPAARNGFLPPVPALGAAKPHFACTNIQNHGKSNLSLKAWQLKWLLNGYYVTTRNSNYDQSDTTYQDTTYPNLPKDTNLLSLVQHRKSTPPLLLHEVHQLGTSPCPSQLQFTSRWRCDEPRAVPTSAVTSCASKKKMKPRNGSGYLWLRDPSWLCPTLLPKLPRKLKSLNVTGVLMITYLRFHNLTVIRVPCMTIQDAEDGMPSWCCVWNRSRTNSS